MLNLPEYQIINQVYNGFRTQVYHAISEFDGQSVMIKILKNEYPTFKELSQFRHQFTLIKNLNLPQVIKPLKLLKNQNIWAMIMEDFGGISLQEYTEERPLELDDFFPIAIEITKALEGLYYNRIIHKDIKPQNILINPQTKQVKLIDFSIASLLPRESQTLVNNNLLEGTLAYISPEQTGRMNRGIDYRSDFYSLGVTFYQLLSGKLPFDTEDFMELIYCHIVKQPPFLNDTIPTTLVEIVQKLMDKTAENRYQSAAGLRYDLEKCWQQWQTKRQIEPFKIGKKDLSDRFCVSEKIYGREPEILTLLSAFEKVAKGHTELMLVSGSSGMGKTAVINEIHKPIVKQKGYFISGKFDQFQRNIPLSALIQALKKICQQLLTESSEKLEKWRDKILTTLGENAQLIIDLIPEVKKIIGEQNPVPELSGSAAENRFNLMVEKFISVLGTKEHPLVIFLDDLQWADQTSLKLIKILLNSTNNLHLLIIGAYRDNEVNPAHPLMIILEELRVTKSPNIAEIKLTSLDFNSLNQMIADTLNSTLEKAVILTELIAAKTQGNPFFINQFLKSLYQEKLITFVYPDLNQDKIEIGWQCDLTKIRSLTVSDDIVEFMANQLQKLPETTEKILQLAACMGNQFDLSTLAIIAEKTPLEIAKDLWIALEYGLIIPQSELYKFFYDIEEIDNFNSGNVRQVPTYKFLHDRVQQAAYFLIPEEQKKATHLKIGKLLLENLPITTIDEQVFIIVNQLNYAQDLITEENERLQLAELNLLAGTKAKSATAYIPAINYLKIGRELLDSDSWINNYQLTLRLYVESAELAYLNAEFEQMEVLVNIVLNQGKNLLDKIKVYEIQLSALTAQIKLKEAVKIGLNVLKLLNVNFSDPPNGDHIQHRIGEIGALFTPIKIADLIDKPAMIDEEKKAALRILSSLVSPAYMTAPTLLPLIILEMVNLSFTYGNDPLSSFAYGLYGLLLSGVLADIDTGYQFGKLALNIVEKFHANYLKTKINYTVGAHIIYGKQHLKEVLPLLKEGYAKGLETADLEMGYSAKEISQISYLMGKELTELEKEIKTYSQALIHVRQYAALNYNRIIHQVVLNLLGNQPDNCRFLGEVYHEEEMLPLHESASDRNGLHYFYFHKMIICYLFNEYDQALINAQAAAKYLDAVTGMINVPMFYFYEALIRLAIYPKLDSIEKAKYWEKIEYNQTKIEVYATHSPENFLHKFYLIEAEKLRVMNHNVQALEAYKQAIILAADNNYINEEAIAQELITKAYLSLGKVKVAQTYMIDAYYNYANWGAKAKIEQLEKTYPQLLIAIVQPNQNNIIQKNKITTITSSTSGTTQKILDLSSILKASQAISQEILLENLLSTLMQILIENAGAEKGVLILSQSAGLFVEVIATNNPVQINLLPSVSLYASNDLPISIINYCYRSQETLLFNDTAQAKILLSDPYIQTNKPKSVLCIPLQKQNHLIGIIYLENNAISGVFSHERLEILQFLCNQAAISLDNAKLYHNLQLSEAREREKSQQLAQAQKQLLHDAFHDSLTNLRNRTWFIHRLYQVMSLYTGNKDYLYAVLFLDLDRFKVINDSLGHLVGDELLTQVGIRLQTCLIDPQSIARLGGDEFAILVEGIKEVTQVIALAKNIQKEFKKPFQLNQYQVYTEASIGITLSSMNYQNPEDILRDADVAMYQAKSQGRGSYNIFDLSMQTKFQERLQLENDLRIALEKGEFYLNYQPIICLETGKIASFEALVRWQHPKKGFISPATFIPIAEETGLIMPLGWWVFTIACHQLNQWKKEIKQTDSLIMNINLSALQLRQENLVNSMAMFLAEIELSSTSIKLEITESCLLDHVENQLQILQQMKDLGLKLCVDDFGTGYSSLNRLHEFPIDTLKIDRSFVVSDRAETMQMIISLAHSLGMDVTAEGIETPLQKQKLQDLGCEYLQGYLFSRPLNTQDATQFLINNL